MTVSKNAPNREGLQGKRKTCKRIDPCYIVLTYIDPVMKLKTAISSRTFNRSFVECSNMCKKVHFKRRLQAGKDVFNVKTPSKQRDYIFYLEQAEKKRLKKGKIKINEVPQINEIIEKHNLKVAARKKSSGKPALPRIRRTVFRIPSDFEWQNNGTNDAPKDLSNELLALVNTNMRRKQHKVELDSLKKLTAIKRSLNLKIKRAKRARTEGFENFLRSDVTSSVSGRVRKANPRYGKEFAFCWRDIEEKRVVDVANTQLKRAESENKRKVEDIKKNQELFQVNFSKTRNKYSSSENSCSDRPNAAKKAKLADVVIDNPEDGKVTSFKRKQKIIKTASVVDSGNVKSNYVRTQRYKEKKKNKGRDEVLIREMTKEENVAGSFLQNIRFDDKSKNSSSLEADGYIKMEPEYQSNNQYPHVKQLLKRNLDKGISYARQKASPAVQTNVMVRQVPVPSVAPLTAQNTSSVKENYKKNRKPETFQKLFTSKEIKKEPLDEVTTSMTAPVTSSHTASGSPKVITVTYVNGVFKQVSVPVNDSPVGQVASSTRTDTRVNPSPVSLNTGHGLKYIDPRQVLPKETVISTSSEAAKTVLVTDTVKSKTSSRNTGPSVSRALLNKPASLGRKFSRLHSIRNTQLSLQHAQQQQGQATVLGVTPSVVQIPVQTGLNSSTLSAPLSSPLHSPPVAVSQGYTIKSAQQSVGGITNSAESSGVMTHTVIHKVLPAAYSKFSQAHTVSSQSNQVSKTPVLQHPMSIPTNSVKIPATRVTVAEGKSQMAVDNCKFYLLKVDGKNVLIPIEGNQAKPKYEANKDFTVTQVSTPTLVSNIASPAGIRPSILRVSGKGGVTQPKSSILPNLKQLDTGRQNHFTVVENTVSSPTTTNMLQTVTLSNGGLIPRPSVVSSERNATSYTTASASVITSQPVTSYARLGGNTLTSMSLGLPKNLVQGNIQTNIPLTAVPVYLSPLPSTQASSNLQLNAIATACNKRIPEPYVKSKIYVPPVVMDRTVFNHKSQSVGLLSDFLRRKESLVSKQSSQDSATAKYDKDCINERRKEEIDITANSVYSKQSLKESATVKDDIDCINQMRKGEINTSASGELCENSGIFVQNDSDTSEEDPRQNVENPEAFKEAVTAREDKLRRLKELIKEKQKAVEQIRGSKVKSE